MKVKFRPSSHSTDYTLVGVCKNEEDAKNLKEKVTKFIKKRLNETEDLDWDLPEVTSVENRIIFSVYSNEQSALDDVRHLIEENGAKTFIWHSYQELNITLNLPEKAGINTLPLLMSPAEVSLTRLLEKTAIKRKTEKGKITFVYHGTFLFDTERKTFEHEKQEIKSNESWTVKVLYDSQKRWIDSIKQLHAINSPTHP
jgi:hypothetical protein